MTSGPDDPEHAAGAPVGDTSDDELAIGRDRSPAALRRSLVIGALGIAAVGAVTVLATHSNQRHRPTASSSTPRREATASPSPSDSAVTYGNPGTCDVISGSGLSCSILDRVPPVVLVALRTVLPGAALVPTPITVTGPGPRVLNRHVAASIGGRTVAVDVLSTGERLAASGSGPASTGRSRQVVVDDGDHSVTVTFTGPPAGLPSTAVLIRLAQDPRLLVPGG